MRAGICTNTAVAQNLVLLFTNRTRDKQRIRSHLVHQQKMKRVQQSTQSILIVKYLIQYFSLVILNDQLHAPFLKWCTTGPGKYCTKTVTTLRYTINYSKDTNTKQFQETILGNHVLISSSSPLVVHIDDLYHIFMTCLLWVSSVTCNHSTMILAN